MQTGYQIILKLPNQIVSVLGGGAQPERILVSPSP